MRRFYIQNENTKELVRHDSEGQHDGKVTHVIADAKRFKTWADASDFSQNFGPEWMAAEGVES